MRDDARGGNDTLIGGDNSGSGILFSDLYGDADSMLDKSRGGNDVLIGGENSGTGTFVSNLFGDASAMHNNARGGNDTLSRRSQQRQRYII